jgi:C4-dicarboxylate-specific signal transduction histidine kinase
VKLARVLIAEDNRIVASDIAGQLARIGHNAVAKTARGDEVLQLVRDHEVDLVLMDIRLEGDVDGIMAAQLVRDHCGLPVIFLTAYADDETVQRASLAEPFGYILKPLEDSQLRTVIEMALYKHASERRLGESEQALREAQSELMRSARLEAMSELAAAITDEMNQPLAAMVTNADACMLWLERTPPDLENVRSAVRRVTRDGLHAADVVRSLRALMRRPLPQLKTIDLNEVTAEILELVEADLTRHRITLVTDFWGDPLLTLGDRSQLQQVVGNLVTNAIEAMCGIDRPRVLRVTTQVDHSDNPRIAVHDSGVGLSPTIANRIFEPLFTTKTRGLADSTTIGTGLGLGVGLSISKTIVEAHGGRLWASQQEPHGCIFHFSLPGISATR